MDKDFFFAPQCVWILDHFQSADHRFITPFDILKTIAIYKLYKRKSNYPSVQLYIRPAYCFRVFVEQPLETLGDGGDFSVRMDGEQVHLVLNVPIVGHEHPARQSRGEQARDRVNGGDQQGVVCAAEQVEQQNTGLCN